jgi:SPP1 family predicted phage head-tail adaptor
LINQSNFRFLCNLLQPIRTADASGQLITAYVPNGQAWFSIRPLWGKEIQSLHQLYENASHKLQSRYIDCQSIDASWRIQSTDDGTIYNIDQCTHYPQEDETNVITTRRL